jgi:hypothetical protein
MDLLGKRVLIQCTNDEVNWVELQKVKHENQKNFRIMGETEWYSKETIVEIPSLESYNSGYCLNCGIPVMHKLLCKGTHCPNDYCQVAKTGFSTTSGNAEKFRDRRIKYFPEMRENLWSRDPMGNQPMENTHMEYEEKLYCLKHEKFLPKSRFADRRLSKSNQGKRYNLHAH